MERMHPRAAEMTPGTGRSTPGVRLEEGDRIAAACLIPEEEGETSEEEKPPLVQ